MKAALLKYVYQYAVAVLIFVTVLIVERTFLLSGLTLWMLSYLLVRRVSFKTVFVLGLVADLAGGRLVGVTGVFLSLLLFFQHMFAWKRLWVWVATATAIALFEILEKGTLSWGYVLSTLMFLVVFVWILPLKRWIFPALESRL